MGVEIITEKAMKPAGELWTAPEGLCFTEDGDRVVPETSTEARTLWVGAGGQVPLSEAIRLGTVKDGDAKPAKATADEGEDQGEAPADKPAARSKRA